MDKSIHRKSPISSYKFKEETLQERVLRKLHSFKNYLLSKFRSFKYELSDDCDKDISIISFEQRSFWDVEKAFDSEQESSSSKEIDRKLVEAFKRALTQAPGKHAFPNRRTRLELLEVIEKTFNRQLDIFQELLQLSNGENSKENMEQNKRKRVRSNDNTVGVDTIINDFVKSIVTEITYNVADISERATRRPEAMSSRTEVELGDNLRMRKPHVYCECQRPSERGAAVSTVSPSSNPFSDQEENFEQN